MMAEKIEARRSQRPGKTSLDREQAVYEANRTRWVLEHKGKHVLIRGDEVVGFYESRDEALTVGYSQFGVGRLFLVQNEADDVVRMAFVKRLL